MPKSKVILEVIASLRKAQSQKQIRQDLKDLGEFRLPVTGTLHKAKTKSQVKQDLASINGDVNLTGKISGRDITASLQEATAKAQRQADAKPVAVGVDISVEKDKLINEIKLLARQNGRMFQNPDMAVKYNTLLDHAGMAENRAELGTLQAQLVSFRSELKAAGNTGQTMTDVLKGGLSKILQLFGDKGIIVHFAAQLRAAWSEAKILDQSMTDLSQANTEITRNGFPDYLDRVTGKAKQLAVSAKDYINTVTQFSKAGYNLADSEALSDMTIQLEKVGGMSAETAFQSLLSGLRAYDEIGGYGMDQTAEKAQALNDKIALIGSTASISREEAAKGIQTVGAVMSQANTSVDEFLALLAAGNRSVQDSGKVAQAIGASALRMQSCTEKLREMGAETDNVIESTSVLAEKIRTLTDVDGSGGVEILETDGETLRSVYDIYNDIAKVYDKMAGKDADALLTLIAGSDNSDQISAVLQNMAEANALLELSLSAAGTAGAEYQAYLNSAEAASERFGAAITQAYSNILGGDTVTGLTNAGTAVLDFANSWGILEGTLVGFLALGILKGVTTLTMAFQNSALQISNYGRALDAVKTLSTHAETTQDYTKALDKLKNSCVNLTDAQLKRVLANRDLNKSQLIEILQLDALEEEAKDARLAELGLIQTTQVQTTAQGAATVSTFSLSAALKGLGATIKAAWASNPVGLIIMGISTAIGLLTAGINRVKQKQEESSQAMQEAKQKYQNLAAEVKKLNEELKTTGERLGELDAIGYENLSLVEQEEYNRLKDTNAELERELQIKEALANVEAQKIANKTRKNLEKQNLWSITYIYGSGRKKVDQIDSLDEYLDLANQQRTGLEMAQKALEDYENAYSKTAGEMVRDKTWQKLNQKVEKAQKTLSDTEAVIGEKYKNLETESEGLVDAFGNVVTGYEEIYKRIEGLKDRVAAFFYPKSKAGEETEEPEPKPEEPKADTQTLFAQLTSGKEALDKFKNAVTSASDAYGTLLSGSYSASELLDSIQTINQAVSDMGGSLNWEFLGRQANSLEVLGDAIQYISRNYAESVLSDAGIDSNSWFGQVFADMIQEAYETEAAFTNMNAQLDNLQSSYQALTEILESYNKTGTISLDNLQSLLTADENLISMLEAENGQLVLNRAAYENLVAVQLLEFKTKLNDAAAAEIEALAKNKAEEATYKNANASNNAVEKLDAETAAFGRNTSAAIANAIAKAEETGVPEEEIQGVLDKYNEIWNTAVNGFSGDFDGFMGGTKEAAKTAGQSAGAQAADAYLEAFEEELDNLKDLKDRGTLTEKEYLDQLKRLYEQYFKDKSDYLDQYQKYEHEYLQGMKSLYESVFGVITKEYGKKIDAANKSKDAAIDALEEQKDAAVDALEAERDARLDALESQKDALQEQADAIEEQIAQKQKLIDGIHDEIDAIRDANQERENEISLQQKKYELERAMNQRTALVYRDGSLQYQSDPAGIREKREEVKNAETEMEIFQKEKQVKAIEKEISLLEERKDLIQEQQDAIDKQMDAISEHYDALIEQTEQQYDGMIRQTEQYWDTILSGFEEYKNRYEELADMEAEAKAMADLKQLCEEMGVTVDQVLGMSDEAFQAFRNNYTKTLAEIYSGNAQMTESLAQLTGMKQSVEGVAAAISGGGTVTGPGTDGQGQGPGTGSGTTGGAVPLTGALDELKKKSDSVLGSGGENADGESQAAGSGVIGRFNRLGQEVKNVTGAIGGGTGENTDGETNDTDAESLNGSLSALGTAAQNILGEPEGDGVTGRFQTLSNILGEANEHVNGIYDGLQNLDGEEAECTITVHIETTGGLPAGLAGATGTSLDTMNLNSARYGSRFARQEGMARVTGDWGVRGGGSTLVGELGQELVVFPNGRFRTVGDNGAEFVDIPDGSIIFNHLQTKELLRKGYLVGRGKVSGSMPPLTDGAAKAHTVTLTDGTVLMPVQPDDQAWDVVKKWDAYVERTGASPDILTNSGLIRYRRQMDAYTGHVNTINSITNNRNLRPNINVGGIHISCPGITSQEVARQVGTALENMFSGLHNYADQYARIR